MPISTATLKIGLIAVWSLFASAAHAVDLVMVSQPGCVYCERWEQEIGPIYPKTEVGTFAPLRHYDIKDIRAGALDVKMPVVFTPTFLVVDGDVEVHRMEGYMSEDFFWSVLEKILSDAYGFEGSTR